MTDSNVIGTTCATDLFKASPEIGNLVSFLGGKVGVFLGFESKGSFARLVQPKPDGERDVFCVLSESLDRPSLSEIDYLAKLYKGGMSFHDYSAKPDTRIDSKIEDMIQRMRGRAHELAVEAVRRIRELSEPSVDGISASVDFMERTGADSQAIENERAALAEARERRRIEMSYEPFDAHTYYAGLRSLGADPCVRRYERGGNLVESRNLHRTGDVGPLNVWAIYEDPDRRLCLDYMRAAWEAARLADDLPVRFQCVQLGI